MKRSGLFLFLFTGIHFLHAQHHAFFDHIWQREGLSQSQVLTLTQDNDGFVWVGTQDGLNLYDGSQMRTFRHEPFNKSSLSDDYILHIQNDGDSLLWINSERKVDVLNFRTRRIRHIDFGDTTVLRIWCIGKKVYAVTAGGIAQVIQNNHKTTLKYLQLKTEANSKIKFVVNALCLDPKHNLLAATSHGLFILPTGSSTFVPYSSHYVLNNIFSRPIRTLLVQNNNLYFSSRNVFYIFNTLTGSTDSISMGSVPQSNVTCVGIDMYSQIWIGTNGNGLFCLIPKDAGYTIQHYTDNKTSFGLTCNYISAIHCSNHKNYHQVWIGTRDAGLYLYSQYKNIFKLHSAHTGTPQGNFFGVVKDRNGEIWTGTQDGIYRINPVTGHSHFIDLNHLVKTERNTFESIYCDNDNEIWVGHGNVLYRINRQSNKLETVLNHISEIPFNHVLRLTSFDNENLLLGTRHGYAVYNKKNNSCTFIDSINTGGLHHKLVSVSAFAKDHSGNLWLGTNVGLVFLDKNDKSNKVYTYQPGNTNTLLSSWILDIKQHENGRLYVSTPKGLCSADPEKIPAHFEHYNHQEGIRSQFIYGMVTDASGKIWSPTNSGIAVFDPVSKLFRTYHSYQGVQFTEFNSGGFTSSPDGELLFAGIGGVIGIYPEQLKLKAPEAGIYLQTVKLNGNQLDFKQKSTWQYWENDFEFNFSVLDYYSAQDVELKYRLNGRRDEWISIDNSRTLSLANLAPGKYTLEIIGVNADGITSNNPLIIAFTIRPPFWSTTWFLILVVLIFLILVFIVYRIRLRNKIRHYREIETVREQEAEKSRKAAALDLHDEFGNGLTRISMLTELVKNKTTENQGEQKQLLNVISEHSQRLYQGTKDFIWSINPGNDNVYETVIRIKDHADELFYDSGIRFSVSGLNEDLKKYKLSPSTGRNLAMIFQEAIYNIVKHAQAANADLQIENSNNELKITLSDDGKGFEMKNHTNSFGLINMKQRANRIGGKFEVESQPQKGSKIRITISLN